MLCKHVFIILCIKSPNKNQKGLGQLSTKKDIIILQAETGK